MEVGQTFYSAFWKRKGAAMDMDAEAMQSLRRAEAVHGVKLGSLRRDFSEEAKMRAKCRPDEECYVFAADVVEEAA